MIGVNIDGLEFLIKKNDYCLDSLSKNIEKSKKTIERLSSYCGGMVTKYIVQKPIEQTNDIKKITKIVQSYSITMCNVKKSYLNKDQSISLNLKQRNQMIGR